MIKISSSLYLYSEISPSLYFYNDHIGVESPGPDRPAPEPGPEIPPVDPSPNPPDPQPTAETAVFYENNSVIQFSDSGISIH